MPLLQTAAHIRPISGDVITYVSVRYMEWAIQPDKRYLKLFTGISNHPVVHLGEAESYDFYVEWMLRYGDVEQNRNAAKLREAYIDREKRKQLGA